MDIDAEIDTAIDMDTYVYVCVSMCTHTHEFSCLLQGERENYERSLKRAVRE
jgi:hypothetical protein